MFLRKLDSVIHTLWGPICKRPINVRIAIMMTRLLWPGVIKFLSLLFKVLIES